jgi:hypothetical protein
MGKATGYYNDQCARYGWKPEPHQIIYRANILIAETGEGAAGAVPVPAGGGIPAEGRGRRHAVGTRPAQRRRRGTAAGQCQPGAADQLLRRAGRDHRAIERGSRTEALELFGKKVLPHIRDV